MTFYRKLQQDLKHEAQYRERLWNRFLQDLAKQSAESKEAKSK